MTLPASGAISLSDIRGEFGGAAPDSLDEYYRGGSLVPNIPANDSIPTSGAISLSDFHGTRDESVVLTDHIITAVGSRSAGGGVASATATLSLQSDGDLFWSTDGDGNGFDSGVFPGEYLNTAPVASASGGYDVRATITSGSASDLAGDAAGIWLPGATATWSVSDGGSTNQIETVVFTLEIRNARTLVVLDSCSITLRAQIVS